MRPNSGSLSLDHIDRFEPNFSPAGWDNEKKIAILYENMHSVKPDQYFTDVIARPIVVRDRKSVV